MLKIHYQMHGLKELEHNLIILGKEIHERGVKRMTSQAAEPIRNEAKLRAPILQESNPRRRPGTLMRSIKIWRKKISPYAVTYYIGVRGLRKSAIAKFKSLAGKKGSANPDDPFYWRFLEFGTSKMRAQPFLRPAFESKKEESVKVALLEGQKFIRRIKFRRARKGAQ